MNLKCFVLMHQALLMTGLFFIIGLCGCVNRTEAPLVTNCASLALSDNDLKSANVVEVTHSLYEQLRATRLGIEDMSVYFQLKLLNNSMSTNICAEFILKIVNDTKQPVVLYFPRDWISTDSTFGAFVLLLREGDRGIHCPGTGAPERSDDAFAPMNFIKLPPHSQCEWSFGVILEQLHCLPGEILNPGIYSIVYNYDNIAIGPEIEPYSSMSYDVGALLGFKNSNRVEFIITQVP